MLGAARNADSGDAAVAGHKLGASLIRIMVKTITLQSGRKVLTFPYKLWREVLELAHLYGWFPIDTLAPVPYPFEEPWDGAYEWPCGQVVPAAGAAALTRALESVLYRFPTLLKGDTSAQITRLAKFCGETEFEILREVK